MIEERVNTGLGRLKKMSSADGFWNIKDDKAQIDKVYVVDLDSVRMEKWHNLEANTDFVCEVIDTMYDDGSWQPFPTELLEITK